MSKFIAIGIGGAIGALLRYFISGIGHRFLDGSFPWGTLIVNLMGAYVIGLLWGLFEEFPTTPLFRSFILIGVVASFTTFSTYSLETFTLFKDGEINVAIMNVLASNVFGIMLVFAGYVSSRLIMFLLKKGGY